MKYPYKIEAIRDDFFAATKGNAAHVKMAHRFHGQIDLIRDVFTVGTMRQLPWVAQITGRDRKYGLKREFVRGQKDYTEANSVGSRGVFVLYILEKCRIYEVAKLTKWNKPERYFFRLDEDGIEVKLTGAEVAACLTENAG